MFKRLGLLVALGLPIACVLSLRSSVELHQCYRCSMCGQLASELTGEHQGCDKCFEDSEVEVLDEDRGPCI